jgi:protein subunit release factor B
MALPTQIDERLSRLHVRRQDVDERFIRGGGPGGQKINKTSSTVSLRHRPTGIEVRCQAERSQSANRERAWIELLDKIERQRDSARQEIVDAREAEKRRTRPKTRGQKVRMIETKKKRARHKATRGRVRGDW